MRYLTPLLPAAILTGSVLAAALGLSSLAWSQDATVPQALVNALWQASSDEESARVKQEILDTGANAYRMYLSLRRGPEYEAPGEEGGAVFSREAEGEEFPYYVSIPADYDPGQSYPVEFALHGGVGRPKPAAGENFWERTISRLNAENRFMVIPLSWQEAYWWADSQADNLTAILKELKGRFNIDENRVFLSGVSDGGTGAYFFAFKQPSEWAAFLPYIGHPGVLRNPNSGGGYRLYFENLANKPLYIVNGENDRLYPAASLASFMEILKQAEVDYTWRVIEDGGHNTEWMPDEREAIEAFKAANPRDPFPDEIQWVADRTDRYNRNQWIVVEELAEEDLPSLLRVQRDGNSFSVDARGVSRFTLLLNPEEINFADPVLVSINGRIVHSDTVRESVETLLNWAARDRDRTMLFTAELSFDVEE